MEIPYTVKPRPDIGLYNAKLGIWLFLASEVMLFGGLFSSYVLLRVGAAPGYWPHGWLDVRFGTLNTIILALSAITTLLAWVACKVGHFGKFKFFHACTLALALTFLCVKMYEYHDKWIHYEIKLNDGTFADGHFESAVYVDKATNKELEEHSFRGNAFSETSSGVTNNYELASVTIEGRIVKDETLLYDLRSQKNIPRDEVKISRADIKSMQNYGPWHNTFLAIYFTLTGLHALHILGGSIVIGYLWGPGSKMWKKDPERFTNRIEVSGLFWHFVDLVWIFLFPVLYLT
jgi:cytochrome c oxidase subunit III